MYWRQLSLETFQIMVQFQLNINTTWIFSSHWLIKKKKTHTQWNYRATPFIYCLTGILVLNICSLCYQSIASGNGPVRRLHIFLVKHIRFPTTQRPRGRTSRLIHKPKGPLNPLGTSPCLPVWDQRIPWSRGSMSRKPSCSYFERRLVLQPAWVWLLESHLKTAFQILKNDVKKTWCDVMWIKCRTVALIHENRE